MEIQVKSVEQVAVVSIQGSLDALTAPELSRFFSGQIADGNVQLVADLGQLEYTSSAGLRALLGAVKEARQQGGDLRLAAAQPEVHKLLDLSGFTSILKVFPEIDSAVASYSQTRIGEA
jgi:anti-sigma B factor antagonist